MTSRSDRPSEALVDVAAARLHEERSALIARLARSADDMGALVAASRDSNADDEHDPEGQTIAYERSQLAALTRAAREHLEQIERGPRAGGRRDLWGVRGLRAVDRPGPAGGQTGGEDLRPARR